VFDQAEHNLATKESTAFACLQMELVKAWRDVWGPGPFEIYLRHRSAVPLPFGSIAGVLLNAVVRWCMLVHAGAYCCNMLQ
jgi:hypothetical protein